MLMVLLGNWLSWIVLFTFCNLLKVFYRRLQDLMVVISYRHRSTKKWFINRLVNLLNEGINILFVQRLRDVVCRTPLKVPVFVRLTTSRSTVMTRLIMILMICRLVKLEVGILLDPLFCTIGEYLSLCRRLVFRTIGP